MAMNTNTANIYITATDKTKQALSSISGSLKGVGTAIASVVAVAGGLTLVNESLKKFADLNDLGLFGLSTDKALAYVDSLKLAGLEQGNIVKSFEDLSKSMANAFNDEKLASTFNKLGISLQDIKKEKPEVIFDKISQSLGSMEDKTKAIALASQIFGKNGLKIVDASQDEEIQAIKNKLKETATEVKYASAGADEFYKNIDRISSLMKNDVATSFSSVLIPVNALLNSIIRTQTTVKGVKSEVDILASADSWTTMIEWGFDFGSVVVGVFKKFSEVAGGTIGLIGGGLLKLIPSINLVGDAIFGGIVSALQGGLKSIGQLSLAFKKFVQGDWISAEIFAKQALSFEDNWKKYKAKLTDDKNKIDFGDLVIKESLNTAFAKFNTKSLDGQKAQFLDSYSKLRKQIIDTVSQDGKGIGGTNGVGADPLGFSALTEKALKDIQALLNEGKDNIDFLQKYNEAMYSANLKDIEEYYQNKKELMVTDYEFQKSLINEQIKLLENSIYKSGKQEEKLKFQEQLNQLLLARNKLENEYVIQNLDINSKSSKDMFDKKMKELNFITQVRDIEIEALREQGLEQGLILENNLKIKRIKEEQIALLEKENALILAQKNITPEDTIKLLENQKKIAVLKKNTDEIAKSLNDSINGAFETMFSNVLTGTKSLKEAFLDMANTINQEIMKILSQQLSQKLISNLMPTGSSGSGGLGGFFSSILGGLGFRATGGGVNAGNAYVVGERGPELFFPQQSGYVANNKDTMNAIGGGNNITVNIYTQNIESFRNSEARIASQIQKAISRGNRVN